MERGDDRRTMVVIARDGVDLVSVELVSGRPDLALVEALARLQLAALRTGCSISLRDACPELCGLLDLVGLTAVLPVEPLSERDVDLPIPPGLAVQLDPAPDASAPDASAPDASAPDASALEAGRQAEHREQPLVEEAVEPRDPSV
jgi:hypothetical protein